MTQERKKRSSNGTRAQRMFSFRLDEDNVLFIQSQPNMGRFLNELIREKRKL